MSKSTKATRIVVISTFSLFNDDGIEEAFPSHCCHNVFGQFPELRSQQLPHPLGILCQILLFQHLQKTTIRVLENLNVTITSV